MKQSLRRTAPVLVAGLVALLSGCAAVQKTSPHIGFGSIDMEAKLDRSDIIVMDTVEGSSTTTSYLFGLVAIIDDSNVRFLFIPFFKEKYTYFSEQAGGILGRALESLGIRLISTSDRAYYKALEKAANADVIIQKRFDNEDYTFLGLYSTQTVTVRGRAVALRPDR